MDSLVSTFHIDGKLLLAQIINFGIIFFVLYRFVFKPLSKVMNERTEKIEKSLLDAKAIEQKMVEANEEQRTIIISAKKEAAEVMSKNEAQVEVRNQELLATAKAEAEKVLVEGQKRIARERDEAFQSLKKEVAEMVVMGVEKVLSEKIDEKKDGEMIKKALKDI